jgi:TPR repeat protein
MVSIIMSNKKKIDSLRVLIEHGEKGDVNAQYQLGAMGDGVGQNESKAVAWYTKAAENGHAEAQFNLGTMVLQGEGVEKNIEKGIWWMEQAVANGYEYSAHVLAMFYRDGAYGIKPDGEKAKYWKEKSGNFKSY